MNFLTLIICKEFCVGGSKDKVCEECFIDCKQLHVARF